MGKYLYSFIWCKAEQQKAKYHGGVAQNIFEEDELEKAAAVRKFRTVAADGKLI